MTPSPTQSNVQAALGQFLAAILPAGTVILAAQQNRTAEPALTNFVVMTPIRFERLETNIDSYTDAKFTGSIAGATMTITSAFPGFDGQIAVGSTIFGVGVAPNTTVTALGTGTGDVGTYTVAPAQTIGSIILSAGTEQIEQHAKVTVQLDFHSADTTAGDMAQTTSTLLRDDYGVQFFAALTPPLNGVVPLYADDPRQMPFLNAEQQYEWRWVLEAELQVNQVVVVPQQFADSIDVTLISVEATYPPA